MKQLMIFKSQTCAPCKALTAMMKETILNVDQVTTVDSSCDREWFISYNVRSVPTSILMDNGHEIRRHVGYTDKDSYLQFIE